MERESSIFGLVRWGFLPQHALRALPVAAIDVVTRKRYPFDVMKGEIYRLARLFNMLQKFESLPKAGLRCLFEYSCYTRHIDGIFARAG